ncbi:amino acid ABC transporter substrate-binding protein [Mobilitalea sibirica]|uniref:Amino acid ABC transporter substrate-binding protein n=1 Tax=Mobilitalea sibirica TaxID=1462919 RepID=A0A8J7H4N4_9FIRM|nr:ABC transporter substrate-binding protein [Mobilitalea sibirica]MBH1942435.1 amino acid ABC transporter substrate-binding protein [Mobilitalea sibirica]
MKKRLLGLLLVVILIASVLAACGTKEKNEKLIVGTEAGFAPYEYMEGDEVVGVDMDIAKAIAESMGKELEIKNMDFDGALLAVQNGTVDFVAAGVSVNEERKKVMDFSVDYVDSVEVVVVNKDNPAVADVEDLDDKVIGVQQGNIADFWVEDNVNAKEIKRYTKFAQAAEDLKNGRIDCIVMDQFPAEELVAANQELAILDGILFEDKYAIAVKKGNKELLDEINSVIEQLKEDGKIEEFYANHTSKN